MKKISDIYVGKQTDGFNTDVAVNVPFERCFTVISKRYTLDVEAPDAKSASAWLQGIKYLLTSSGKAVIMNENKKEEEAEAATSEAVSNDAEASAEPEATATEAAPTDAASQGDEDEKDGDFEIDMEDSDSDDDEEYWLSNPTSDDKRNACLLICGMQQDFLDGGSVNIKGSASMVPLINDLRKRVNFKMVALTKDERDADHIAFLSSHAHRVDVQGNPLYYYQPVAYEVPSQNGEPSVKRTQVMWPTHCVKGTPGAEFHPDLVVKETDKIVVKATDPNVDSYSAFLDNDRLSETDLHASMRSKGITDVYVCGVPLEYGVGFSCLDAQDYRYRTYMLEDLSKGVAEDVCVKMKSLLKEKEVILINSAQIPPTGIIPMAKFDEFRVDDFLSGDAGQADDDEEEPEAEAEPETEPTPEPEPEPAAKPEAKSPGKKVVRKKVVKGTPGKKVVRKAGGKKVVRRSGGGKAGAPVFHIPEVQKKTVVRKVGGKTVKRVVRTQGKKLVKRAAGGKKVVKKVVRKPAGKKVVKKKVVRKKVVKKA